MKKHAIILTAIATTCLLFLLPGGACGQRVELPKEVAGDPGTIIVVKAVTDCPTLRWVVIDQGLSLIPPDLLKDSRVAVVMAGRPGRYRILAYGALKDAASDPSVCIVVVGEAPPPEPGPGPGPGPNPPPGPSPIPGDGLRVLIVYETADLSSLPRPQLSILTAGPIREYLNARCVKGPDGKTAEWRIWDKDVDTKAETKTWQDAMARPRKTLPWIVISTGKGGFEGPLPADVNGTLDLLKKYGG